MKVSLYSLALIALALPATSACAQAAPESQAATETVQDAPSTDALQTPGNDNAAAETPTK